MLRATARPFPTTGGSDGAATPVCTAPQPMGIPQIDQLECYCTTTTCGAGMLDAGAAVSAALNGVPVATANYQGLWWNAPAGSESGWGINVNHQGNTIYATWFTFGLDGKPLWLVVSADSTPGAPNVFSGNLFSGTGPPFSAFDPTKVVPTPMGRRHAHIHRPRQRDARVFGERHRADQDDHARGVRQPGADLRLRRAAEPRAGDQLPGPLVECAGRVGAGLGAQCYPPGEHDLRELVHLRPRRGAGVAGGGGEREAPNVYTGTLVKAISGPAFKSVPFNPTDVNGTPTGNLTLTFADGNNATFAYSIDGIAQSKQITREVLVPPGTVCQ